MRQALYLLAIEPVSEMLADPNSYGFRIYRGCRDAIAQCFRALGKKYSPKWVLEADIKACFDWIDHNWLLENIPVIKEFLADRGLTLSEEKTKITRIEDGFDFLGQNLQKFNNKLITRPSKDNIKSFHKNVRNVIKSCRGSDAKKLITKLNPVIRGWANYHKYVQSSDTFSMMDNAIYYLLMKWAKRKHGIKTPKWIRNHYWKSSGDPNHFSCITQNKTGKSVLLELIKPIDIKLHRYIKVRGKSNPYDPEFLEYYKMRRLLKNSIPIAKLA